MTASDWLLAFDVWRWMTLTAESGCSQFFWRSPAPSRKLTFTDPLHYSAENVSNFNSLQIWQTERCVFSSMEDSALGQDMVTSN
jgi:hypothetical protein